MMMRDSLPFWLGNGDGYVLTVAAALLLAILTGRSDLCIAAFLVPEDAVLAVCY